MKSIFRNPELHDVYERDGFVVLPLLTGGQIQQLRQYYTSVFVNPVSGLYTSHSHSSGNLNMQIHNTIGSIVRQALDKVFCDYDFVVNHFIAKSQVNSSEFRLHQDWTIVEEEKNHAAHIWCPLQDTSPVNGGMFVVKGSHTFFDNYRSGSMGMRFMETTPFIRESITTLHVKAGEALVYKQGLFHGSYPNQSAEPRLVALCSIKSNAGPWVYYEKSADYSHSKMVDVFGMNTEAFLAQLPVLEKGGKPVGLPLLNSVVNQRMETSALNEELFAERIKTAAITV